MADTLTLITQVSSTVTLMLVGTAVFSNFAALRKLKGGGKFEKSVYYHSLFLGAFMVTVAVMSLYHWFYSELFEELWYAGLNISLILGIVAGALSYKFWKGVSGRK